jgi:hypothetical protein
MSLSALNINRLCYIYVLYLIHLNIIDMRIRILLLATLIGLGGAVAAQRTCSTMENLERLENQDPQITERMQAVEDYIQQYLRENPNAANQKSTITIPVVFHVVYNTSAENISASQINSQITVLQDDFNKQNSDYTNTPSQFASLVADVGIEFVLADTDPNGNAHSGITRTYTSTGTFATNDDVKYNSRGGKNAWPSNAYLNFWVCDLGPALLGYAQFPGGPAATDGVVCHYKYTGTNGQATAPYNLGRTATHEVGHWLNLRHIWGDQPCGNDQVNDTPTQLTSSSGCPSHPQSSCLSNDMFMNYMDYTSDACMFMFSNGQKSRMLALFGQSGARSSFVVTGCNAPTGLSSSAVWENGFTLSWSSAGGASTYDVQTRVQGTGSWTTNNTSSTSKTYTGLSSSTTYEYRVRTDCSGSNSSYGNIGSVTTSAASACSSPSGISSSNYTTSSFDISWTSVGSANSYDVQLREQGTGSWATNNTNDTSYSFSGLDDGAIYEYRVRSKCTGSNSANSAIHTATTVQICNAPTGVLSSSVSTSGFTVSWSAATYAQSYKVDIRGKGLTPWASYTATATSYTFSGLKDTTVYEYRIATNCTGVSSTYTTIKEETTLNDVNYCASKGANSAYEWIEQVIIGSLNNYSGNDGGYADYTNLSSQGGPGDTVSFAMNPGFTSVLPLLEDIPVLGELLTLENEYPEYWRIWIDFNDDSDFSDAGELVFDAGGTSEENVNGYFIVPSGVSSGLKRMRVSMKFGNAPSSCGTFSNGEVEDYTFEVVRAARMAQSQALTIRLFPNPSNNQITLSGVANATVYIADISGRVMYQNTLENDISTIQVAEWNSGIYSVQITKNGVTERLKFVVE